MLRAFLSMTAVLALCVCAVAADKDKDQKKGAKDGKHHQATITKVDAKKGTITLRVKNKEGKQVERTFKLAEDVVYFDNTGRVAQADIFVSGNDVLVVEREGKIKEVRKAKKSDHKEDHKNKEKTNQKNKEKESNSSK